RSEQWFEEPFERGRELELLAMVDARHARADLLEGEDAVEPAHGVREGPGYRSHVDSTMGLDREALSGRGRWRAAEAAALEAPGFVAALRDRVYGADLQVGRLVSLQVEDELVDVARSAVDQLGAFSGDHSCDSIEDS